MKKLAIITTHPIQYNAPWFQLLAKRKKIEIKVYYTWSQVEDEEKFDPGFGKVVEWDIPLLDGYEYTFVKNISKNPGSKNYKGINNPTLIQEVNDWKPDAVLIFGWKFKSHLKALKYYHNKIPVLFRGDSNLLDQPKGIKGRIRDRILKNVYKNVDHALCVGSENKRFYKKMGLLESQLAFAPHAVDNYRFNRAACDNDFRKELGIPSEDMIFLFAGKLEKKKNPELLANTFLRLNPKNCHLLFVGNGPLENILKEKFIHPRIHFMDFQNQQLMPSVYKMADVFVLPSQGPGETWGLAVNEAMACGKPVLVSDKCGCAPDLVEDGVTGYVFKSNDEEDLTSKIACMIDQKDVLKKMGKSAFERIQGWSFEKIAEAVEEVVSGSSQ